MLKDGRSWLSLSSASQHFCCWTQNPVHQEKIARAGPFTSRLVVGLLLRDVALRGMFQGRSAADPKKAHPRISTTSGMPNAMVAHISSFAHGTSAWDLISL